MHNADSPPNQDRIEARLEALEIKAIDADDTLEALNRVLIAQQQQIDRLSREIAHLRGLIPDAVPGVQRHPRDDIPPHY